jgi:hypothetical protein
VRIGALGQAIKHMRENKIEEIVLAGRFRRPSLLEMLPDRQMLGFLFEIGPKFTRDDALHKAVVGWAERLGFRVVGPDMIDRTLLATEGRYGRLAPDEEARRDIERGVEVAKAVGRIDVGQGAIVQQGIVLAVEAVEGTDAMIDRAGKLRRKGPGGVLVKVKKPGQEKRVDLPTIGLRTIENAKAAGLRGIAVEAGAALVLDREAVARAADAAGLFVVGITVPD